MQCTIHNEPIVQIWEDYKDCKICALLEAQRWMWQPMIGIENEGDYNYDETQS